MLNFGPPISRTQAAFRGLLALALGIAALAWPGITIAVAVALFAIYCFADAIAQLMRLFSANDTVSQRAVMILLGAFDVAAGVVAIVYPGITAGALVIVIGVWAIPRRSSGAGGGVEHSRPRLRVADRRRPLVDRHGRSADRMARSRRGFACDRVRRLPPRLWRDVATGGRACGPWARGMGRGVPGRRVSVFDQEGAEAERATAATAELSPAASAPLATTVRCRRPHRM
jgi:hypothetical protein